MRQWRRVSFWFAVFIVMMAALALTGMLALALRIPR